MKPQTLLMAGMLLVFYVDGFVVGASLILALTFALVGVIVVIGFRHHGDHEEAEQIRPQSLLLAALGALAVLTLTRWLGAPVVVSAATVGTAGGLLEAWGRGRWSGLGAVSYCGAFAGMTSELVLTDPGWVLLAGALAGLLFELLQNSWTGIGGKLGSTAFLGVLSSCALALIVDGLGPGAPLHSYTPWERVAALVVGTLIPQITHLLSYRCELGPVLGSSLPSLVAGFLLPPPLATIALGASFVGMSTPARLVRHGAWQLLAMGLLFGLFSLGFEPFLAGIGGDLGATAAVSVFAVLGLRQLCSRNLRQRLANLPTTTTH